MQEGESPGLDTKTLLNEIKAGLEHGGYSANNQVEVAFRVLEAIERFCPKIRKEIYAFRACLIPTLEWQEEGSMHCLLLEWRHMSNTDVTVLLNPHSVPCSMVVVSGMGRARVAGRNWEKASLRWMVSELTELRTLLAFAHRVLRPGSTHFEEQYTNSSYFRICSFISD